MKPIPCVPQFQHISIVLLYIPMITKSYNLLIVCIEIVCRYKNELNYDECITFKTKNITLYDINQRS